jgi:hypothetical protein
MKINDPAAHLDTCHKLTRMKGLRQVVIGPGSKPFYYLFFVGVAREQDEMRVETLEVATYEPA